MFPHMTVHTTDTEARIKAAKDYLLHAFKNARQAHDLSQDEAALVLQEVASQHQGGTAISLQPSPALADAHPQLPSQAPELWVNRDLNLREKAPTFIRRVYAPWLGRGLTRKALGDLDFDLYRALSVWLTRHPDDPTAQLLPRRSDATDALIERLSAEYSIEGLRKLGHAIESRIRRKQRAAARAGFTPE